MAFYYFRHLSLLTLSGGNLSSENPLIVSHEFRLWHLKDFILESLDLVVAGKY